MVRWRGELPSRRTQWDRASSCCACWAVSMKLSPYSLLAGSCSMAALHRLAACPGSPPCWRARPPLARLVRQARANRQFGCGRLNLTRCDFSATGADPCSLPSIASRHMPRRQNWRSPYSAHALISSWPGTNPPDPEVALAGRRANAAMHGSIGLFPLASGA
jgi:hypothetical protein